MKHKIGVNKLPFHDFDVQVGANDKSVRWQTICIIRIIVLARGGKEILSLEPHTELTKGSGQSHNFEFLLGQILPGTLDPSLDKAQLRRTHALMLLWSLDRPLLAADCGVIAWQTDLERP